MAYKPGESGNLKGRPPRSGAEFAPNPGIIAKIRARMDGWINMITALGTDHDKRTHSWFAPDIVTDVEAQNLWRGDDICKRIIEAPPKTEFRRGFTLKLPDKGMAEDVQSALEEMQVVQKFVMARCFENAYGGSALFPITDDIGSLMEPIDMNSVNRIDAIHLFEPRELTPVSYYNDLHDPKFGHPELWRLTPINGAMIGAQTSYIHESRLIIFPGRRFSKQLLSGQRPGWGDSKLTGVYPIVRDFGSAWGHVATLLQDFSQGVLKMDGYADLMQSEGGEEIVKARLRMLDYMRSSMRSMVVDKNDDFLRQTTPLGGASDILHDMAMRISAAAEQPASVLFGLQGAGMNSNGDNDVRAWYDNVASDREHQTKPKLEQFLKLFLLCKDGPTGGVEPDNWSTEFKPLWEPSEKEVADTRLAIAQADKIYAIDIGACTADDVAESRWEGDTFSPEMTIDWARRKKQRAAEDLLAKQQQDAQLEAMAQPKQLPPGDPNADPNAPQPRTDPPPADPKAPPPDPKAA